MLRLTKAMRQALASRGGKALARQSTPEERRARAVRAVTARWAKARKTARKAVA